MIRFAYPLVFLLLALLPVLWVLWLRPQRRAALRYSGLDVLAQTASPWPARLRLILPVLRTAGLACLIVAVARPQKADESSSIFAEGVAIQMVVDTSTSMTDTDLSPRGQQLTRLDVVKDVVRRFVEGDKELPGRKNDLIGLIRFARFADSVCPLTLDHANLIAALAATNIVPEQFRRTEDGTAIGDGLALAVERLRDLKRTAGGGQQIQIKSRVVILLTDGENNAGVITPEQAGELAATQGVRVYSILAGTGQRLSPRARAPVNDKDLRRIAEVTGGKFFTARDQSSLLEVYREIDALERTKTEERRFVRWGELSRPWLLAAFACVALQLFLDSTWLRRIP